MSIIDERIRKAARRIVRECAGVRAGEDVYIEGRARRGRRTSSCSPSSASWSARRRSSSRAATRSRTVACLELPAEQLATRRRASDRGRARRPTSSSRCAWSTATRRSSPTCRRSSDAAAVARPQAARRPHLRRHPALDRHRLPDAAARRRPSGSTCEPSATCSGAASTSTTGSCRASAPSASPRSSRARDGAHHVAQGHRRDLGIAGRPLDKDIGVVGRETTSRTCRPARSVWRRSRTRATARWSSTSPSGTGGASRTSRSGSRRAARRRCGAAREFESSAACSTPPAAGSDVIGELGIGLNPDVGEPTGYTLTDEKILGTVHLALGENEMLGGVNDVDPALGHDGPAARPSRSTGGRSSSTASASGSDAGTGDDEERDGRSTCAATR